MVEVDTSVGMRGVLEQLVEDIEIACLKDGGDGEQRFLDTDDLIGNLGQPLLVLWDMCREDGVVDEKIGALFYRGFTGLNVAAKNAFNGDCVD